jgi:hypothetical protein
MAECTGYPDVDRYYAKGLSELYGYTNSATGTALGQYLNPCPRKKSMNIQIIAKKLLNPDLRTLIKAGVLNSDLTIANRNFILEFYVQKHLKELAMEARAHMIEFKKEQDAE